MSLINETGILSVGNATSTTRDIVKNGGDTGTFIWIWPVLLVVTALGFVGNVAVLWIISTVEQFRKPANYLLANLSLISLLLIISVLSVSLQKQVPVLPYSPWVCRFFPAVHWSPLAAEGLTMMQISLDRTRVVRRPLERETKGTALRKIAVLWGVSIGVLLFSGILFWNYDANTKDCLKCSDWDQSNYGSPTPYVVLMFTYFFLLSVLPAVVMVRDLLLLTWQLRFLIGCQARAPHATEYQGRRQELIRNAIVFTVLFIVFKVPAEVHLTLHRLPRGALPDGIRGWVRQWRKFFFGLMVLRSFFSPIIIFSLSTDIRSFCSRCISQ